MLVTGFIIAGAVKGLQIYHNTRLQSVFSTMKAYESAANQFRDAYKFWPGDFRYATTNLVGCTPGSTNMQTLFGFPFSNNCTSGSGDHLISINGWGDSYSFGMTQENFLFFRHMALADMIDPTMLQNGTARVPTAELGGVIFARSLVRSTFTVGMGLHLIYSSEADDGFRPSLSPVDAAYLETKFDNGNPFTGKLRFHGAASLDNDNGLGDYDGDGTPDPDNCTNAGVLKSTVTTNACMMGVYIDQ